jgi:hypothetical protein
MKFISILLLICISHCSLAQDNLNTKQMVGFGCYFSGQQTKPVIKVAKLIEDKKYKDISSLLNSKNEGERYLAVITLQRLADTGKYQLSQTEKELIEKAKLSDDLVSVCSGCTYFDKVPMKTMLSEKDLIGSSYWLDRVLKTD